MGNWKKRDGHWQLEDSKEETNPGLVRPGSWMQVHGLKARPELNTRVGQVQEQLSEDRHLVVLSDERISLKASNLIPLEDNTDFLSCRVPAGSLDGPTPSPTLSHQGQTTTTTTTTTGRGFRVPLPSDSQPESQQVPSPALHAEFARMMAEEEPVPAWPDQQGTLVTRVVVATSQVPAGAPSTPLDQLFDDADWRARMPGGYSLAEVPYAMFASDPESRVLSYRWQTVCTLDCVLRAPGQQPSDPDPHWIVAVDFVHALPLVRGALWVDCLCHLSDSSKLPAVLNGMGNLYSSVTVLPLYLHFATDVSAALLRGWIFQEVAFGTLDRQVVGGYMKLAREGSLKPEQSGSPNGLVEFLRKRPHALSQLVEQFRPVIKIQENTQLNYTPYMIADYLCGKTRPESYVGEKTTLTDEEFEGVIDTLCCRQRCDITNRCTAMALIEGFGKSEFTQENDSVFATLQTAAALLGRRGIGPVGDSEDMATSPQLSAAMHLLGDCWKTLLTHASHGRHNTISIYNLRRTIPGCRTAGLGFGWLAREHFSMNEDSEFADGGYDSCNESFKHTESINLHGVRCTGCMLDMFSDSDTGEHTGLGGNLDISVALMSSDKGSDIELPPLAHLPAPRWQMLEGGVEFSSPIFG